MMMNEGDAELGKLKEQRKAEASKNFVVADKTSSRITDKTTRILEKARNRREATYEGKFSLCSRLFYFTTFCKCCYLLWYKVVSQ
jgi:hypothetical protein